MSRAARIVRKRTRRARAGEAGHGHLDDARSQRDPLDVPIEEKIALLLAANEAALKVPGVRFVSSSLALLREVKTLRDDRGHATSRRR